MKSKLLISTPHNPDQASPLVSLAYQFLWTHTSCISNCSQLPPVKQVVSSRLTFARLHDHHLQSSLFKKPCLRSPTFPETLEPLHAVLLEPSFAPTCIASHISIGVLSTAPCAFLSRSFSPTRLLKNREGHYLSFAFGA